MSVTISYYIVELCGVLRGILPGKLWVFYYKAVFKNYRRLVKATIKTGM
jgi:hypothetical protein